MAKIVEWWFVGGVANRLTDYNEGVQMHENPLTIRDENPYNIQIIRRTKNYRVYWPLAENRKPSTYKDLDSLLTTLTLRGVTIPETGPWRKER